MNHLPRPVRQQVAMLMLLLVTSAQAQSIDTHGRPPAAEISTAPTQRVQVTGGGNDLSSPHTPRTGAYSVKHEGDTVIVARCLEGGTVIVSRHSIDRVAGTSPEARRDVALRESCRAIDFTK